MAESEEATGHQQRALRRAARTALLWPIEATELVAQNRSLTELNSIGPYLEKLLLRWITAPPPLPTMDELGEDFLTLSEAKMILQKRPDFLASYHGDLQMHTTWSDGSGSTADMSEAAIHRGYHYIAITDHSKGLKIAGGINEEQLEQQGEEIKQLNRNWSSLGKNFRVIHSVEMNLNPSGQGDLDSKALKKLDLVLGSFHSSLRTTNDQTERYLAALRHPYLRILGHPRGRVFNYRLGLKADWARVFAEAARLDKAVEVDSYPDRQDLNVELLKIARQEGCWIAVDTDAHHPWQLEFVELGLAASLEAGIRPDRIVNFLSLDKLLKWAKS